MEDDLKKLKNWKTTLTKNERQLKKIKIEDDLNKNYGRQHKKHLKKLKTTSKKLKMEDARGAFMSTAQLLLNELN